VSLALDQGYTRREVAKSLGINGWVKEHWESEDGQAFRGNGRLTPEQDEIKRLKAKVKRLEMERDILKKRRHLCYEAA